MMLIPRRNYGLNLFDEFFNDPFFTGSGREKSEEPKNLPVMRTDIREKDGNYLLDVELPGFFKEDIRIELKEGYLTISAQTAKEDDDKAAGTFLHRERYTGSCKRSFYVGEQLRQEDIHASFANGVLRLVVPKDVPKAVEDVPKYISIN